MNRLPVLFAAILAVIIAGVSQNASANHTSFHGHISLFAFDSDAPVGSYVRATTAGRSC
jgi:hypothetical protein